MTGEGLASFTSLPWISQVPDGRKILRKSGLESRLEKAQNQGIAVSNGPWQGINLYWRARNNQILLFHSIESSVLENIP